MDLIKKLQPILDSNINRDGYIYQLTAVVLELCKLTNDDIKNVIEDYEKKMNDIRTHTIKETEKLKKQLEEYRKHEEDDKPEILETIEEVKEVIKNVSEEIQTEIKNDEIKNVTLDDVNKIVDNKLKDYKKIEKEKEPKPPIKNLFEFKKRRKQLEKNKM